MRIQHRYLTFDKNEHLVKILDKLSVKYTLTEKSYNATTHYYALEFYLYEDNPKFLELKEVIDKFKIIPQIGTVYEKEDIEKAEWFIVSTGKYQYPQPEDNFEYKKVTYDLQDYCELCDIGKIQNAPFRIKTEPKQYNNQFWGLNWEFSAVFVRQETKNILEREQIKQITFSNPLLNKKNIKIEGFYQLHIEKTLDKGFDSYNTKIITCKINNEENCNKDLQLKCCGRVKYHHPMVGGYLFDKTIFNTDFDIVDTNEYFGSGRNTNKLQIVSKRFKQLVEKNKLKGLVFTPIVHDRLVR